MDVLKQIDKEKFKIAVMKCIGKNIFLKNKVLGVELHAYISVLRRLMQVNFC